ncbi:hypothetical protein JCM10213_006786 [Rhodosporidiobolus nylandii]
MSTLPPPKRTVASPPASTAAVGEPKPGWKTKAKGWGLKAFDKGTAISDKIGPHVNNLSAKFGGEAFWPVSNDFPSEVEKCVRILRAFTVDGVEVKDKKAEKTGLQKQGKVFKKIPASIMKEAKGVVIYASNRMGTAPFGGSGGSGLILARLPDGSWSAPSAIAPGSFSGGLMFGIDIFEAVLVIRTEEALQSFHSHQVTLGAEVAIAAGHWGAGAIAEAGKDRTPVYSYVRSRGFYIGAEAIGQAWFSRFDENERVYGCIGISQKDILTGHFRPTPEAQPLLQALRDAETGIAQRLHGQSYEFEQPFLTKDAGMPDERSSVSDTENEAKVEGQKAEEEKSVAGPSFVEPSQPPALPSRSPVSLPMA